MPIATFHTVGCSPDQRRRLLEEGSVRYAEALGSPVDRVRAYVVEHAPGSVAVGGRLVSDGAAAAPYFTAVVLQGRPAEQRARLLADLTDLVAEVLEVAPATVRGHVVQVSPEDWGIGGRPAAQARADEIRARQSGGAS